MILGKNRIRRELRGGGQKLGKTQHGSMSLKKIEELKRAGNLEEEGTASRGKDSNS